MNNVPNLRFKEFNDKWTSNSITNICDIKTGRSDLNTRNADSNGKYLFFTGHNKPKKINTYNYINESIIIIGSGSVGNLFLCKKKFNAYQRTYILDNFKLNIDTVYYILVKMQLPKLIKHKFMFWTKIPNITLPFFRLTKLYYPENISEQQKIANFFTTLDNIIEGYQTKVKLYQEQKQYFLKEMLTVNDKGVPNLRFKEFKGEWKKNKLSKFIKYSKNSDIKAKRGLKTGFYNFYTCGNSPLFLNEYNCDKGGLFISTGGLANIHYSKHKCAFSTDLLQLKSKNNLFFYYFLINEKTNINNNYFMGSGLKHLQKIYFEQKQLLPPFNEQQKIADFFTFLDNIIEGYQTKVKLYQEQKQYFLKEMFV